MDLAVGFGFFRCPFQVLGAKISLLFSKLQNDYFGLVSAKCKSEKTENGMVFEYSSGEKQKNEIYFITYWYW